MGEVYEAADTRLERTVSIKTKFTTTPCRQGTPLGVVAVDRCSRIHFRCS
jgi:hypothetical protein